MAPNQILEGWIARLADNHLLMGPRDAVAAELGTWLSHLGPASEPGGEAAAHELYKLVAFHARELGLEGRPASAAIMQVLLLEESLEAPTAPTKKVVREMLRVVADAHALGLSERITERHNKAIRAFSPVFRSAQGKVVAFLLGPMTPDAIDSIMTRMLNEVGAIGASTAVLDLLGADPDDDRFHRTIEALLRSSGGAKLELVLTGLRDPDGTRAALEKVGADLSRIRFATSLSSHLGGS